MLLISSLCRDYVQESLVLLILHYSSCMLIYTLNNKFYGYSNNMILFVVGSRGKQDLIHLIINHIETVGGVPALNPLT